VKQDNGPPLPAPVEVVKAEAVEEEIRGVSRHDDWVIVGFDQQNSEFFENSEFC
jgi:hypothetical protein